MSSFRLNMSVTEPVPPVTSVSLYDCFERNPQSTDVLLSRAKMLFNKYEFRKCLKVLEQILARDPFHIVSVTYQVGCLFEIRDYNSKCHFITSFIIIIATRKDELSGGLCRSIEIFTSRLVRR